MWAAVSIQNIIRLRFPCMALGTLESYLGAGAFVLANQFYTAPFKSLVHDFLCKFLWHRNFSDATSAAGVGLLLAPWLTCYHRISQVMQYSIERFLLARLERTNPIVIRRVFVIYLFADLAFSAPLGQLLQLIC